MSDQNWRVEVDATDYFGHQKKKTQVADRRPVIRKASDLVGPGILPNAVQITNYNDLLATYNGFYSSDVGASFAPNDTDTFSGTVVSDSALGGSQSFTSLQSGLTYTRTFLRNLLDPSALFWGDWVVAADSVAINDDIEALETRATVLEGRATVLEGQVKPLYTGLLSFFMTNIAVGDTIGGTATFPITFPSTPVAWAIKAGFSTGSQGTVVGQVDSVNSTSCRVVLLNTGPGLATFTDLPVRWFAQLPN